MIEYIKTIYIVNVRLQRVVGQFAMPRAK
jgi:hypothetical protein